MPQFRNKTKHQKKEMLLNSPGFRPPKNQNQHLIERSKVWTKVFHRRWPNLWLLSNNFSSAFPFYLNTFQPRCDFTIRVSDTMQKLKCQSSRLKCRSNRVGEMCDEYDDENIFVYVIVIVCVPRRSAWAPVLHPVPFCVIVIAVDLQFTHRSIVPNFFPFDLYAFCIEKWNRQ